MKAKRNLLSVLLVSVLLVATVCGVLVFGASAATEKTWYVDSANGNDTDPVVEGESLIFATVRGAMTYAGAYEDGWGANETLRIEIKDTAISVAKSGNILFSRYSGRIFREGGSALPITIAPHGNEKVTITLEEILASGKWNIGNVYWLNDFTFSNIHFDLGGENNAESSALWYVASQRLEFRDCTFDTEQKTELVCNGYLFDNYYLNADTYSHRIVDGKLQSEVIFSGSTVTGEKFLPYAQGAVIGGTSESDYWKLTETVMNGEEVVATVKKNEDLVGKITVKDSATVTYLYGSTSTGSADNLGYVDVKGGTVTALYSAYGRTSQVNISGGTVSTLYAAYAAAGGTAEVNITGGTISALRSTQNGKTIKAGTNVTFNINGGKVALAELFYSGSGSVPAMADGATITLNYNAGTTHGNFILMRTAWTSITGVNGTVNLNVNSGAKIGKVVAIRAQTGNANKALTFGGEFNVVVDGGTVGYVAIDERSATTSTVQNTINGTLNYTFKNNATLGDFTGTAHNMKTGPDSQINVTFENMTCNNKVLPMDVNAKTAAGSLQGDLTITLKDAVIQSSDYFCGARLQNDVTVDAFAETSSITLNVYGTTQTVPWVYCYYGAEQASDLPQETSTVDINANFYGGTIKNFRPAGFSTINGNLNVEIDTTGAEGAAFTVTSSIMLSWGGSYTGSTVTNIKGCEEKPVTINGTFFGATGQTDSSHTLENVTITEGFAAARAGSSTAKLTNTLTNVKIGTFYVGNGCTIGSAATTGKVTNELTNVEFTNATNDLDNVYYYGGSYNTSVRAGEIVNEFTNVTMPGTVRFGNRAGTGTDVVTSTINSGNFAGGVYGGGHTSYDAAGSATINIKSGTFTKAVIANATTGSVVLKGGKIILNGSSGNVIDANKIEAATVIRREQNNFKNDTVYFTLPASEDTSLVSFEQANGIRGYAVVTNDGTTFAWEGRAVNIFTAYIDVTNRTKVRLAIDKAQVEEAWANGQDLSYKYTCGALNLYVDGKVTDANWDAKKGAYVVELPAVAAADFGTTAYFNGLTAMLGTEVTINSIINQALAENSGFTTEQKAIFEALGNYGKAAAGTLEQAALDAAVIQGDASDIPTSGLTAVKGAGAINFENKTLLMGDTIGIRLIADEATKANLANAKVYLGETELVSAGLCVVNAENGTVDLFINARKLNTPLTFVVEDGAGATCLTLTDTVKHIAAQLVGVDATNMKAQATYNLIQAVQALIAAEQA